MNLYPINNQSQILAKPITESHNKCAMKNWNSTIVRGNRTYFFAPLVFFGAILVFFGKRILRWLPFLKFLPLQERLDWVKTKEDFAAIYHAVLSAQGVDHNTNRTKKFKEALKTLSPAARKRFEEHICFARAKREGARDAASQEKWMKDNYNKVDFERDYFADLQDIQILAEAVEAFHLEIENKTDVLHNSL